MKRGTIVKLAKSLVCKRVKKRGGKWTRTDEIVGSSALFQVADTYNGTLTLSEVYVSAKPPLSAANRALYNVPRKAVVVIAANLDAAREKLASTVVKAKRRAR